MPTQIIVVGLGPGAWEQMTLEAQRILADAETVWLRTTTHPTAAHLPAGLKIESFDYLYEREARFADIYERIATALVARARETEPGRPLIYCVPGHPLVGEASVRRLLSLAREAGVGVRIVAGLSPLLPALITQVYNDSVAGAVKLALLEKYPPDHPARIVMAAGVPGEEQTREAPLAEIDHGHGINHLACVYLPPLDPLAHPREMDSLIYLMGRLRGPGGCPWDREQSHASLRRYLLEEAYEALEAIDSGDPEQMVEELGDLLLQIVFHAQVAVSEEEFTLGDVVHSIVTKLVRRHPHVFGAVEVEGAAGVVRNWQTIKTAEKRERAAPDAEDLEVTALLRSVPQAMPALEQSHQISERAVQAGFEWDQMEDVFAKVHEELEELRTATDPAHRQEELGDLLFTLVNVARWWGVDAEETLRAANRKFVHRFAGMERLAQADGKRLRGLPVAEMETYWQAAKQAERA